jgi:hypothetical protein
MNSNELDGVPRTIDHCHLPERQHQFRCLVVGFLYVIRNDPASGSSTAIGSAIADKNKGGA